MIRLWCAFSGPADVVLHPPAVEVPDVAAQGSALLLLGIDKGVGMVIEPELEGIYIYKKIYIYIYIKK